jgi:hypothetical protein
MATVASGEEEWPEAVFIMARGRNAKWRTVAERPEYEMARGCGEGNSRRLRFLGEKDIGDVRYVEPVTCDVSSLLQVTDYYDVHHLETLLVTCTHFTGVVSPLV